MAEVEKGVDEQVKEMALVTDAQDATDTESGADQSVQVSIASQAGEEIKTQVSAKEATDADDTENGEKNVQEALAAKIAQMDAKKNEDKSSEKELSRMYKKASKELKEQLEAIASESEKVKFLQQKFLDKVHQCNSSERKAESLQVFLLFSPVHFLPRAKCSVSETDGWCPVAAVIRSCAA